LSAANAPGIIARMSDVARMTYQQVAERLGLRSASAVASHAHDTALLGGRSQQLRTPSWTVIKGSWTPACSLLLAPSVCCILDYRDHFETAHSVTSAVLNLACAVARFEHEIPQLALCLDRRQDSRTLRVVRLPR
jgi:hypothetical protein